MRSNKISSFPLNEKCIELSRLSELSELSELSGLSGQVPNYAPLCINRGSSESPGTPLNDQKVTKTTFLSWP